MLLVPQVFLERHVHDLFLVADCLDGTVVVIVKEAEIFKAGIHLTLFAFAAICLAYNAMRCAETHEAHSVVNVSVYGALVGFECWQIKRHLV